LDRKQIFSKQRSNLLDRCEEITDDGLEYLVQGLKRLPSLTNLSLVFEGCFHITDSGLDSLGQAMQALPHLTNISLNFRQFLDPRLDEARQEMQIRPDIFLAFRSLCLVKCSRITEAGLEHLSQGLETLTSLTHLSLNFNESGNLLFFSKKMIE